MNCGTRHHGQVPIAKSKQTLCEASSSPLIYVCHTYLASAVIGFNLVRMSALPPKADVFQGYRLDPVLTQSGHSVDYAVQWGCPENQVFPYV